MKRTLYILIFLFLAHEVPAQFIQGVSQYMFNGLVINPAYAGSRDALNVAVLYRDQWKDFEGAPVYQYFSAHAPVKNEKMGLGLLVMNEKIGIEKSTGVYGNYAYKVGLKKGSVSFGFKAGLNTFKADLNQVKTIEEGDVAFNSGDIEKFIIPNFGFGVYYISSNLFLGGSIPLLLNRVQDEERGEHVLISNPRNYNYFFSGGGLFSYNESIQIKPTFLLKYHNLSPVQIDLTTSLIYKNKIWFGLTYRYNEALATIVEFQLNEQLRIGYAYDYTLNMLRTHNGGSHEFLIEYEFKYRIKAYHPRYF
ncbi:MAG: type IX secretion system membrane protein PorP/SprF [bacterium]